MIKKCILSVLLLINISSSNAETLDYSCMKSFPVKSDAVFNDPFTAQTMSCEIIEEVRKNIFVNNLESMVKHTTSESLANATLAALDNAKNDLKEIEKKIVATNKTISAKQLALMADMQMANIAVGGGIVTCAETLGGGCAVSALGALYGIYSSYDGVKDVNELTGMLRDFSVKSDEYRKRVVSLKSSLPDGFDASVKQFNELCGIIKNKCM